MMVIVIARYFMGEDLCLVGFAAAIEVLLSLSPGDLRASRMLRGGADNAERGQRGIRARIGAESADKADPRLPF